MKNLISSYLMGGLGNQTFQIAHALSQGWKHDREVVFPSTSYTTYGRPVQFYINNFFRKLKFVDNINGFIRVHEGSWTYSEINPLEENTVFEGYFQSSKNFFEFHDKLRDIFSPPFSFVTNIFNKYPQLKEQNTLSLHIRRGDYVGLNHIHPTVGKSYIYKALETIGYYSHIFIFTDDKEWFLKNIKIENLTIVEDEKDYEQIWMMSLCSNHIISNSTFSWWGSFLNPNPSKIIIAPSIWFGISGPSIYNDIYESYWTLLNVESINGELEYKNI